MMIRMSPKDPRGYIGLGVVLEELFYMSDMYGIKETEVHVQYTLLIQTVRVVIIVIIIVYSG